jgi:hypothetical protein
VQNGRHTGAEQVAALTAALARDVKTQLLLTEILRIGRLHGRHLRCGWPPLLRVLLALHRAALLPPAFFPPDALRYGSAQWRAAVAELALGRSRDAICNADPGSGGGGGSGSDPASGGPARPRQQKGTAATAGAGGFLVGHSGY